MSELAIIDQPQSQLNSQMIDATQVVDPTKDQSESQTNQVHANNFDERNNSTNTVTLSNTGHPFHLHQSQAQQPQLNQNPYPAVASQRGGLFGRGSTLRSPLRIKQPLQLTNPKMNSDPAFQEASGDVNNYFSSTVDPSAKNGKNRELMKLQFTQQDHPSGGPQIHSNTPMQSKHSHSVVAGGPLASQAPRSGLISPHHHGNLSQVSGKMSSNHAAGLNKDLSALFETSQVAPKNSSNNPTINSQRSMNENNSNARQQHQQPKRRSSMKSTVMPENQKDEKERTTTVLLSNTNNVNNSGHPEAEKNFNSQHDGEVDSRLADLEHFQDSLLLGENSIQTNTDQPLPTMFHHKNGLQTPGRRGNQDNGHDQHQQSQPVGAAKNQNLENGRGSLGKDGTPHLIQNHSFSIFAAQQNIEQQHLQNQQKQQQMRIPSKNNEPPLIASPRKSGNLQFFEDSSSILNIEQGKRSTPTGFVDPSTVLARDSQDPQMAELHPPPYAEQQAPQQVQAAQNQPTVSKKISFSQQSAGLHYFRDKKSTAEHIMQTGNSSGLMKIVDGRVVLQQQHNFVASNSRKNNVRNANASNNNQLSIKHTKVNSVTTQDDCTNEYENKGYSQTLLQTDSQGNFVEQKTEVLPCNKSAGIIQVAILSKTNSEIMDKQSKQSKERNSNQASPAKPESVGSKRHTQGSIKVTDNFTASFNPSQNGNHPAFAQGVFGSMHETAPPNDNSMIFQILPMRDPLVLQNHPNEAHFNNGLLQQQNAGIKSQQQQIAWVSNKSISQNKHPNKRQQASRRRNIKIASQQHHNQGQVQQQLSPQIAKRGDQAAADQFGAGGEDVANATLLQNSKKFQQRGMHSNDGNIQESTVSKTVSNSPNLFAFRPSHKGQQAYQVPPRSQTPIIANTNGNATLSIVPKPTMLNEIKVKIKYANSRSGQAGSKRFPSTWQQQQHGPRRGGRSSKKSNNNRGLVVVNHNQYGRNLQSHYHTNNISNQAYAAGALQNQQILQQNQQYQTANVSAISSTLTTTSTQNRAVIRIPVSQINQEIKLQQEPEIKITKQLSSSLKQHHANKPGSSALRSRMMMQQQAALTQKAAAQASQPQVDWQVVEQKSAIKQFLCSHKQSNGQTSPMQKGKLNKSKNLFSTANMSRPNSQCNHKASLVDTASNQLSSNQQTTAFQNKYPSGLSSLRQSQSTSLNLRGQTMALNDLEAYNSQLKNQRDFIRLKHQGYAAGAARSRTPQYVEDEFVRQSQSDAEISTEEQDANGSGGRQKKSRNKSIKASISKFQTVDNYRSSKLGSRLGQREGLVQIESEAPASTRNQFRIEDSTAEIDQISYQPSSSNMPIKMKFRHSFLRHDPSKGNRSKLHGRTKFTHSRAGTRLGSRQTQKRDSSVIMTREASAQSHHANSSPVPAGPDMQATQHQYDHSSGEKNRRMPGVSACLNQGVLPRQHKHIKQVISMIASQQTAVNGDHLDSIKTTLIQEACNVNAVHQRIKENAQLLKEETEALENQLAICHEQSLLGVERVTAQVTATPRTYNPIGETLQQARYSHENIVSESINAQTVYNQPIGVKLIIGDALPSPADSPSKSLTPTEKSKELIQNKIEGARKVFDAAKLRSVLLEQKQHRNNTNNSQSNKKSSLYQGSAADQISQSYYHQSQQQQAAVSPFTKTEDFFKISNQPKNSQLAKAKRNSNINRVLNIFLNVDGEIRRQSGTSLKNDDLRVQLQRNNEQNCSESLQMQLIPAEQLVQLTQSGALVSPPDTVERQTTKYAGESSPFKIQEGQAVLDENNETTVDQAQSLHTLNQGESIKKINHNGMVQQMNNRIIQMQKNTSVSESQDFQTSSFVPPDTGRHKSTNKEMQNTEGDDSSSNKMARQNKPVKTVTNSRVGALNLSNYMDTSQSFERHKYMHGIQRQSNQSSSRSPRQPKDQEEHQLDQD